jgi:hypothetical protein
MKINRSKQRGATLITWLIIAGLGILMVSAVVKVAPFYMEFNTVKNLMENIASEPGIKRASPSQINAKIEKYLAINNLRGLEASYYSSGIYNKSGKKKKKKPFKVLRMKKGKNRKLTVEYTVPQPWIAKLSFLMDFGHAVVLGEPKMEVAPPSKKQIKRQKIKLN